MKNYLNIVLILILPFFILACTNPLTSYKAALQVTSVPESDFYVDGKKIGTTPFYSDQLSSKVYEVKIATGEASWTGKIKLNGQTLSFINRNLNPKSNMGQSGEILTLTKGSGLTVISNPAGANVELDGKFLGTTPQTFKNIDEGDHQLILSHDGYEMRSISIHTQKDFELLATVDLSYLPPDKGTFQPASQVEVDPTDTGWLRVRSQPTLNASEVGHVNTGEKLTVFEEKDGWLRIESLLGTNGWVLKNFTSPI